jgi:multiple sugar transport system substrate-binding protein
MQNRTRLIILSITIASFLFAVTCRNGNNNSPDAKTLSLALASGVEGDALKQAAREYEAQTGVRVRVAEFPYDDLFAKELVDLNAQTGAYDVVMLDDPWFARFATPELLAELTPLYQKQNQAGPDADFVATSLALCKHPYETGKLYALPYVGNSQLFFYRQDLFDQYNLKAPQTWDDVLAAAKVIDEGARAGAPDGARVHGYVMRAARGNSVVADFLPIFWAFGAEMFDESGKPAVNSAAGVQALKLMLELGQYAPPGYASFNATEVSAHLLQGTAAMAINWPAWISAFSDPAKSKVIGKMAFTTMPGKGGLAVISTGTGGQVDDQAGRAEIGNWLVAIPKGSQHQQAAFDFIAWATAPEQMKKSALIGNPPTRRSVFNDAELIAKFPSYPAQLKSLETAKPRPRTPLWNEIENVFGIYLSRANSGELSAEEAMNQANAEITRIVERAR